MKKIRLFIIALVFMVIPFISVNAAQKVNVYLFRGEGCPHCSEAEKFFDALSTDSEYSNYYNLVKYEVWYDEDNADLMEDVAEALDTKASGVPFIVIGDKYFSGYSSSRDTEIKDQIKASYNSSTYVDVVKGVNDGTYESPDETYEEDEDTDLDLYEDYADNSTTDIDVEFEGMFKELFEIFASFFTALGLGFIIAIAFLGSIYTIFDIIVKWFLFRKAGRHGWEAIIPFYNRWVLYEISGYPGYYMFFIFIPCVGFIIDFVFSIMAAISISKKFKEDPAYAILIIFLPIIGYGILAFGSKEYDDSLGEQKNKKTN